MDENIEEVIKAIAEFEGLEIQEAKLTYAARQELPPSAFCGPNKTYPAHDAAHVRNGFARLSTFGHRLKPAVRERIHACLLKRAKRFGVEHKGCKWCSKKVEETIAKIRDWYLKKVFS